MISTILFEFVSLTLAAVSAISSPLSRNADEVAPLLIGAEIPHVAIVGANGETTQLSSILDGKPSVIIFYRGGWCPYCNLHLKELADIEQELLDLGFQIIAISPDSVDRVKEATAKLKSKYKLYSDASFHAADAFGISYNLSKKASERMKSRGLNPDKLLVPSVFISTPDSVVSFQYVDPNFRFRISGNLLLAAAKASAEFHIKK